MKAVHLFSLVTLILFTTTALQAYASDIDIEKNYSKSYKLNATDLVEIENRFGSIVVSVWDRDEVKIDATITASARSERRAQEILDDLEIVDRRRGNDVSFVTKVGRGGNVQSKGKAKEIGFDVEMRVYIPATQPLDITMEFGDVQIPDYRGELEIVCKFGKLYAGELDRLKSLEVEFGGSDIERVHDAEISSKFSHLTIEQASGDLELTLEFSNDCEIGIAENFTNIDLVAKNSNATLKLPRNLSARYDIQTSFGNLNNRTDFDIAAEKKSGFDVGLNKEYRGTIGSGKANIDISADFSEIRLED